MKMVNQKIDTESLPDNIKVLHYKNDIVSSTKSQSPVSRMITKPEEASLRRSVSSQSNMDLEVVGGMTGTLK